MSRTKKVVYIAVFCALMIVGGFIKIPMYPVSITLQVEMALLAGLLLGPNCGALAVLAYIALGLIGLPIFTNGGGPAYVLFPTFGYMIGFVLAAFAAGHISRKKDASVLRLCIAALVGVAIIYAVGVPYFWAIYEFHLGTPASSYTLLYPCFLLPLGPDCLLCIIIAIASKRLKKLLDRNK